MALDKKTKTIIISLLIILLALAIYCLHVVVNLNNKSEKHVEENDLQETQTVNTDSQDNLEKDSQQETIIPINNEDKYYYFAYGSNMDIDNIRERTDNHDIYPISSVYINNYKLTFPGGVGNIEKSNGQMLWGCLFLLNISDIHDLDIIEGYKEGRINNTYNREKILVKKPGGQTIEAYVYIQPITGGDTTSESYKNTLLKGASDCNLPADYIDKLKNINITNR